jgi:hypothetical protein
MVETPLKLQISEMLFFWQIWGLSLLQRRLYPQWS